MPKADWIVGYPVCQLCEMPEADVNHSTEGRPGQGCTKCGQLIEARQEVTVNPLQHVICPPALSLLVIDFDGNCAVKLEKGESPENLDRKCHHHAPGEEMLTMFYGLFDELRRILDETDDKPVPRIEREPGGGWHFHWQDIGGDTSTTYIGPCARGELETLIGGVLPIYEPKQQGTWTQLYPFDWFDGAVGKAEEPSSELVTAIDGKLPLKIWRYTR